MKRLSSLTGLAVIASSEGLNLGRISEVVVDLAEGVIVGVVVGAEPAEKGIMAEDIDIIGTDAIMISDSSKAKPLSDVPKLTQKRREYVAKPLGVMTQSGQKLGIVGEIFINPETKQVTLFEVSGGPLRDLTDGSLSLPAVKGMTHGRDVLLVPDKVIAEISIGAGGLKGVWAKLSRQIKKDYQETSKRTGTLYEKSAKSVKSAVEQTKKQSKEISKAVAAKLEEAKTKKEASEEIKAEAPAEEAKSEKSKEKRTTKSSRSASKKKTTKTSGEKATSGTEDKTAEANE